MQFSKKALFLQPSLCISENKYVRCAVHLVFNTFGYGPFTDFMGLTPFTGFRGLTWSSISLHITENRFDISKIRGSLHYSWHGLRYILNFVLQLPYINAPWKLCKTFVKQGVFRGSDMPSHAECRKRVCAICWNRTCKKVVVTVHEGSDFEKGLISHVDSDYRAADLLQGVPNI